MKYSRTPKYPDTNILKCLQHVAVFDSKINFVETPSFCTKKARTFSKKKTKCSSYFVFFYNKSISDWNIQTDLLVAVYSSKKASENLKNTPLNKLWLITEELNNGIKLPKIGEQLAIANKICQRQIWWNRCDIKTSHILEFQRSRSRYFAIFRKCVWFSRSRTAQIMIW